MQAIKCYDHIMSNRISIWGKGLPPARDDKKTSEPRTKPKAKKRKFQRSYPIEELAQHLPELAKAKGIAVPEPQPTISEPIEEPKIEETAKAEPVQEEETQEKPPVEEPKTVRRYQVLKRRQRRRSCMSISVSEEEEDILREAAAESGLSFSSWAREALFRAAKRKIPNRPR